LLLDVWGIILSFIPLKDACNTILLVSKQFNELYWNRLQNLQIKSYNPALLQTFNLLESNSSSIPSLDLSGIHLKIITVSHNLLAVSFGNLTLLSRLKNLQVLRIGRTVISKNTLPHIGELLNLT
jgi:hypothetical protein